MQPLSPQALYTTCDLSALKFETTEDLEELVEIAGQDRAIEALRFGVDIEREGYNLFVMGPSGMGKYSLTRKYLEQQAAQAPTPDDWCYVNNFEHPQKPKILRFPAGKAKIFRKDIQNLIDDLLSVLPSAFESDQYQISHEEIEEDLENKRERAVQGLADEAEAHNIRLVRTPRGFSFQPIQKGEVLSPDEYAQLSEKERARIEEIVAVLQEKLEHIIRQFHLWKREARNKLNALNRDVALSAVKVLVDDLKQKYPDHEEARNFLDSLQQDVIEHKNDFLNVSEGETANGGAVNVLETFGRYDVNLLVDNAENKGLPVIYEDSPTYERLVGRVEHISQMGTLITDFRLVKPGALHCANGGYLILDVIKLLTQPFAWDGLKRALKEHAISIQSLGQRLSLISTVSLEPDPVPLDVKVVLLGERKLFYLLLEYDPEFPELFKVAADFENDMERTDDNQAVYAQMIATIVKREKLLPFRRDAVERIIEQSARLAHDSAKLSNHLLSVTDMMREADHWSRGIKHDVVTREDVQHAIDAKVRRAERIRDRVYEEIMRDTILIDTDGEKVGQINGLSVADLGNFVFAQPFRITATARLGHGDVVDIEREVELGGAIHSKGVLILSSYLGARYAKDQPLSLAASLVFEQSYGEVEGDSASVGELCALLSVLASAPVRQWLAVTGSVNQHGQVQAIGGVNEKVEGFFDICERRGLSGKQGVIIPASNVKHLMLRANVVAAAEAGKFHIYPVKTVDEAIELLTGVNAGETDEEGKYPADSVNGRVMARLEELTKLRHEHAEVEKDSDA
jgi:lon-related putative ATP-dependent protease